MGALAACAACGSFGSADSDAPAADGDAAVDAPLATGDAAGLDDASLEDAVRPPVDGGPVDGGADGPFVPGPACGTNLDCERVVFVTSAVYTGNLGGVAGADDKCKVLADAAALPALTGRVFTAWLSADGAQVSNRLLHGTRAYRLVDGTTIASDWTALTSGTLAAPIHLTETGAQLATGQVWTGSTPSGALATLSCTGWTGTAGLGAVGQLSSTTTQWTSPATTPCVESARLYCFEH